MRELGKKGIVLCLSLLVISSMCFNGGINASAEEEAQTGHEHTQTCYATAGQLLCNISEDTGHTHDETCRDESGNLTCGQEERQGHTHGEGCYAQGGELICGFEEQTDQNGETSEGTVSASDSASDENTAQEETEKQEEATEDKKEVSADAVASIGNTEYSTLAEAMKAVKDGDTVYLWKDVKENIQTNSRNYTLDMQGHQIEPSPSNTDRSIFCVAGGEVTIKNGTFANGKGKYGGLWIYQATFTGEKLVIKNNTSTYGWGGMRIQGSIVNLTNCEISGNTSAYYGAGIGLRDGSKLTGSGLSIKNNSFLDNQYTTYQNGGGIYVSDADSSVELKGGSIISGNKGYRGAGIYTKGNLVIDKSKVSDNTSSDYGGGICAKGKDFDVKIQDSTIAGNKASQGGGIYATESLKLEISDSKISSNSAETTGGGLETWFSEILIENVSIEGNNSQGYGAAMAITCSNEEGENICIDNTKILNNVSKNSSVLAIDNTSIQPGEAVSAHLKGCSIADNKGEKIIKTSGKGILLIEDGNITENTSDSATIYTMGYNPGLKLKNSIVKNNTSTGDNLSATDSQKASGGICATSGNVTMEGGAVYDNRTATGNKANDWYIANGVMVDIPAANSMKDTDADFEGYVWQDSSIGDKYAEKIKNTLSNPMCLTAVFGVERDIAKIGDTVYHSIADAIEAANEKDTIVLIAGDNDEYGTKIYSDPVTIDKNVTIDVNERTINFSDKEAFKVKNHGNLMLKGAGQINGEISVEEDSSLKIDGPLKLGKISHEGKQLELNAAMDKLSVDLSQDRYVTAGADFDCKELKLTLPDAVLEQLNSQIQEVQDIRIVKCENAEQADALAKKIKLVGLENNLVSLKYMNGFLTLHKDKLEGVFLDGVNGSDENSGLNYNAPVKSFERAKDVLSEVLKENPSYDKIYVLGAVQIKDEKEWDLDGKTLSRYPNYKGHLVYVNSGKLTLKNIVIDGASDFGVHDARSLISVSSSAELYIEEGAVLQNSNVCLYKSGFGYGGAISNRGSVVMNNGVIQNCKAEGGGAIYCQEGTVTLNGGSIINNQALNEKTSGREHPSGGGIYINGSGQMIMNGGLIEGNKAGWGGGIALGGNNPLYPPVEDPKYPNEDKDFESFIMNGGTISKNESSNCGGGIFVQCTFKATIYKGNIIGNVGGYGHFSGGGIYVNGGNPGVVNGRLQVYNVCITNNTAELGGGGVAGCATSYIQQYMIKGGVIYGNTVNDQKNDILISNIDHKGIPSISTVTKSYISEFMLGGGTYMWKWTGTGKYIGLNYLHEAGIKSIYTDLKADDAPIDNAMDSEPTVFITGNYAAQRGGGIGSNGDVIIGSKPTDKLIDISVKKIWKDNDNADKTRPDKIWVWLLRNGERVSCLEFRLDSDKPLTFTDQPKCDENGKEYVYTIEEDTENLYGKYISTVKQDEKDKTSWTVTNTLASLTVSKTVSGLGDKLKEFTFTVTLDDKTINGIYGDMEFKDGVATFTLKDGEHKTAGNLPNGTKYTVSESDNGGYVVTVNGKAGDRVEGTVIAGEPAVMKFNNYKGGGGTTPGNPDTPDTPNPPDTPDQPLPPDDPLIPDEPDTPDNPDKPLPPDDPLIEEPENPKQPDEPVQTENPKTGDESNLIPWAVLLAVGAAGVTGVVRVRKKKNS